MDGPSEREEMELAEMLRERRAGPRPWTTWVHLGPNGERELVQVVSYPDPETGETFVRRELGDPTSADWVRTDSLVRPPAPRMELVEQVRGKLRACEAAWDSGVALWDHLQDCPACQVRAAAICSTAFAFVAQALERDLRMLERLQV